MGKRSKRWGRALGCAVLGGAALLLILAGLSALSNRGMPSRSLVLDRLVDHEKARLAEQIHLRKSLGDSIWPGWDRADLPVVLYNERYAFLIGYPDPPAGWIKIPRTEIRGGAWEVVPGDNVGGSVYYRQVLVPGVDPEAFTVKIGNRWAASMQTKEWFRIALARRMRSELPSFLAPVFPYRLVTRIFVGGTDGYIAVMLHETFHAYQGTVAPDRVVAAERATAAERDYPGQNADFRQAWQEELGLLEACARVTSREEVHSLARRFLAHRNDRRSRYHLTDRMIDYERQREWLEGLAKYVELEAWRLAAKTPDYQPLPVMASDPDFERYTGFDRKWSQELSQMKRSAREEVRFYYSGMAQAAALDRLMPGWKMRALPGTEWLEVLVSAALASK